MNVLIERSKTIAMNKIQEIKVTVRCNLTIGLFGRFVYPTSQTWLEKAGLILRESYMTLSLL